MFQRTLIAVVTLGLTYVAMTTMVGAVGNSLISSANMIAQVGGHH